VYPQKRNIAAQTLDRAQIIYKWFTYCQKKSYFCISDRRDFCIYFLCFLPVIEILFFSLICDPLDLPGRSVTDYTTLKFLVSQVPYLSWLAPIVPSFLRVPRFMLTLSGGRF
jgi:hypothetical protein